MASRPDTSAQRVTAWGVERKGAGGEEDEDEDEKGDDEEREEAEKCFNTRSNVGPGRGDKAMPSFWSVLDSVVARPAGSRG